MAVTDVKRKYERSLLSIPGVVGVFADTSRNVIVVLIESPEVCQNVPSRLEGYPVECRVTGRLGAL
jgi:hypothetical protein